MIKFTIFVVGVLLIVFFAVLIFTVIDACRKLIDSEFSTKQEFKDALFFWRPLIKKYNDLK